MKWFCKKRKRFIAPPKVSHFCEKRKCPHLQKKNPNEVIYRLWRNYVNAELKLVRNPQIGNYFAGKWR